MKFFDYMKYGKFDNNIKNNYIEFINREDAEAWGKKYYCKYAQQYKKIMESANKGATREKLFTG